MLLAILVLSSIKYLSFAKHISAVSKLCFLKIRDLRRIRHQTTACTIATSLIHSKIDDCNSLLLSLSDTQPNRIKLSSTLLLVLSPKLLNFIPLLLFLFIFMSILLAILLSSLIKICHLHNISLLFLNHAFTIFVT